MTDALDFLRLIVGNDADGYLEIRSKNASGMVRQAFFEVAALEDAARAILDIGAKADCWVGVAPRARRSGTAEDVHHAPVLSADLDGDAALDALDAFEPKPTAIIASGSRTPLRGRRAVHAHWALVEPVVGVDAIETAKKRLAAALGADSKCTDAARIMRVPGTRNFKYNPPAPVALVGYWPERRYELDAVVGHLPEPEVELDLADGDRATVSTPSGAIIDRETGAVLAVEPLKAIPAEIYVERLLETPVPRSRKVRCPFPHPNSRNGYDRTPSLHVYDGDRGWYCHGCNRGGDIFTLAGYLIDLSPRRRSDFLDLKRHLRAYFAEELAA